MNTTLKEPRVGKNIPTVAKMTQACRPHASVTHRYDTVTAALRYRCTSPKQGEVIKFAAAAAEAMRADGFNVLMEGRAQTLDYVRAPSRVGRNDHGTVTKRLRSGYGAVTLAWAHPPRSNGRTVGDTQRPTPTPRNALHPLPTHRLTVTPLLAVTPVLAVTSLLAVTPLLAPHR